MLIGLLVSILEAAMPGWACSILIASSRRLLPKIGPRGPYVATYSVLYIPAMFNE